MPDRSKAPFLFAIAEGYASRCSSWLPVPAMSFLIIVIVFYLSQFSFTLFAKDRDLKNEIGSQVVKNLVFPSLPLNPVSLLNFCKGSCETLCKCTKDQGVSSECVCGGCEIDKIE